MKDFLAVIFAAATALTLALLCGMLVRLLILTIWT